MKKLITLATITIFGIAAQAQNKNAKHDLYVEGNCGHCKERIENAAYSVKGVKVAQWNEESHNLHIVLNETKNNLEEVENAIVAVGHDTEGKKADEKVYENLPACCHYKSHQDDEDHENIRRNK